LRIHRQLSVEADEPKGRQSQDVLDDIVAHFHRSHMPKKLSNPATWPFVVQEHLVMWGKCIRYQRLRQQITGTKLCSRLGISRTTLYRIEQGSPSASVGIDVTALPVLGIAVQAIPVLYADLWQEGPTCVLPNFREAMHS
jgi:DNA-binding XRE family transcriptional regulator